MLAALKRRDCCMTNISFDLSKKTELRWLSRVSAHVRDAAGALPFFVVGAVARHLLLQDIYGIHTGRETQDVDFAFFVPSLQAFQGIRAKLLSTTGFAEIPGSAHRLRF